MPADIEFINYTEHRVTKTDSLAKLAKQHQLHWKALADFNWGVTRPVEVNRALHAYVGCTRRTLDNKNYRFDDSDDPGIVYIPKPSPEWKLATGRRHVIEIKRARLLSQADIETVDEFGHREGNVSLLLKSLEKQPDVELTTNAKGYVRKTKIRAGRYAIRLSDGSPTWYHIGRHTPGGQAEASEFGEFVEAVLDTAHHTESITTVVVKRNVTEEQRRERREVRQRYVRTGVQYESDGQGTETSGLTTRSYYLAVDNLAIAAGCFESGDAPVARLTGSIIKDWVDAYHPGLLDQGYYVWIYRQHNRTLELWDPGSKACSFEIREEFGDYMGPIGAYGILEQTANAEAGEANTLFRDLKSGQEWIGKVLEDHEEARIFGLAEIVTQPEKLVRELNRRAGKYGVVYVLMEPSMVALAALLGGAGRLDDYGVKQDVNANLHRINLLTARAIARVYDAYLNEYIEKVRATSNEDELRALGPPRSPFEMPSPAGSTTDQKIELLDAIRTRELRAWTAIAEQLDLFANRKIQGQPFLRVKMKTAASSAYYNKIKDLLRPDLPKLPEKFPATEIEVETNLDLHYNQGFHILQKNDISYKFTLKTEREFKKEPTPAQPGGPGSKPQKPGDPEWMVDVFNGINQTYFGKTPSKVPFELSVKTDIDIPEHLTDSQRTLLERLGGPLKAVTLRIGPYKFERKMNGAVKLTMDVYQDAIAVTTFADPHNAEFGGGFTFKTKLLAGKLRDWMKGRNFTEQQKFVFESVAEALDKFEMDVVVGFQGLREETALAVVSRAPGFFERRSLRNLMDPRLDWNSLSAHEQIMLANLGWRQRTWDMKYWLSKSELPKSLTTRGYHLTPTEKVAVVHLGFYTYDEYAKVFEKTRQEYNPQSPGLYFLPL